MKAFEIVPLGGTMCLFPEKIGFFIAARGCSTSQGSQVRVLYRPFQYSLAAQSVAAGLFLFGG
jgi:hypothetical protein